MPCGFLGYPSAAENAREIARRAAWRAHYERKGCHPFKARDVASRKCSRSSTWPPK